MSYDTESKSGEFTPELIATAPIEAGSLVAVADGHVSPPSDLITLGEDGIVLGLAQDDAALGEPVVLRRAAYALHVADGITLIPGQKVFATDNETVSNVAAVDASIPAGVFLGLDADGKALVDVTLAPAV